MSMRIHHVGYLVKNIHRAETEFVGLGFVPVSELCRDTIREVDILFLEKDGYVIELVSPYTKESVVAGLMKTYRNAPYHICYETDDPAAEAAALREQGFVPVDELTVAPAMGGRRVQFFMSARTGLLEIVESAMPEKPACGSEPADGI